MCSSMQWMINQISVAHIFLPGPTSDCMTVNTWFQKREKMPTTCQYIVKLQRYTLAFSELLTITCFKDHMFSWKGYSNDASLFYFAQSRSCVTLVTIWLLWLPHDLVMSRNNSSTFPGCKSLFLLPRTIFYVYRWKYKMLMHWKCFKMGKYQ